MFLQCRRIISTLEIFHRSNKEIYRINNDDDTDADRKKRNQEERVCDVCAMHREVPSKMSCCVSNSTFTCSLISRSTLCTEYTLR